MAPTSFSVKTTDDGRFVGVVHHSSQDFRSIPFDTQEEAHDWAAGSAGAFDGDNTLLKAYALKWPWKPRK